MIKHMVLFRFKPDTPDGIRARLLAELSLLPTHFPKMQRFGLGVNVSKRDSRFTHVMTLEFEMRSELEKYLDSEHHEAFVQNVFRPNIEERAIASYEC